MNAHSWANGSALWNDKLLQYMLSIMLINIYELKLYMNMKPCQTGTRHRVQKRMRFSVRRQMSLILIYAVHFGCAIHCEHFLNIFISLILSPARPLTLPVTLYSYNMFGVSFFYFCSFCMLASACVSRWPMRLHPCILCFMQILCN